MYSLLTIIALSLGQVDDKEFRTKVSANPFECAHARSFHFDKTGRRLVCVTQRGELLVWNDNGESPVVTGLEKKPDGHIFDRAPTSAVLPAGGAEVVLFYRNGRVQVWSTDAGLKTKDLESDRKDFGYAYSSPDGELVAGLSHGREGNSSAILFWNTKDWSSAGSIETAEKLNDFCFTADGRQVLACVGHPTDQKHLGFTGVVAWNLATKKEADRIEYGSGFPIRIAVSPDGRWVATGGGDAVPSGVNARSLSGHLRIFDWESKKFVTEPFTLATDYVRAVQFSPDSRSLYSGLYSLRGGNEYTAGIRAFRVGSIRRVWIPLWEATIGKGNPHEFSVSPNGNDILAPVSGGLQIVDAKDGTVRGAKLKFRFYPEDRDEEKLKELFPALRRAF